jgi:hypothetical protein
MHWHLDSLIELLRMLVFYILFLLMTSWGLAAPTTRSSGKGTCPARELKTARYDDLPFVDGGFNPIPPHYYGLSYTTFQVDQYDGWFPATSGIQTTIAFGGSGNISIPDTYIISSML